MQRGQGAAARSGPGGRGGALARVGLAGLWLALLAPGGAPAEPFPHAEGSILGRAEAETLKPWLPQPLWAHREILFHPGMQLEIGPAQRDYAPAKVYQDATQRFRGQARIGPEGTLLDYQAGRPFPEDTIACESDPEAGTRWIWNFVHRWQGFGVEASFHYSWWEKGKQRPLLYQGRTLGWLLKHRPEARYASQNGDVFPGERRALAVRIEVEKPESLAGTRTLTFRYEASYGPPESAQPEDTWIYSPEIRRTRKISERQRYTAFAGTDFTFDDLFSFSGLPPQYRWRCLREGDVLAPGSTRLVGHPLASDTRFGESGLSLADDRWELRRAVVLEMKPKDPDHPYARKELWIDRQTGQPLYAFAYDRTGALWKIIYHAHRWSEDTLAGIAPREWYPAWEEVEAPRDLRVVADIVINVQAGTGNRLEFWDTHGPLPDKKRMRLLLSPTRLGR